MSITVIEELCRVDDTAGNIVVESTIKEGGLAITELQGGMARRMAIMAAAKLGLPDPRANGSALVYPVDEAGRPVSDPLKQKTAAYRADIPVTRRLV